MLKKDSTVAPVATGLMTADGSAIVVVGEPRAHEDGYGQNHGY